MENPAAELLRIVVTSNDASKNSTKGKLLGTLGVGGFSSLIGQLASLREDVVEGLNRAPFRREERRAEMIANILDLERNLVNSLVGRDKNTTGPLIDDASIERLRAIVHHLDENGNDERPKIDRATMMRETEALIADVKEWNLEDHPKRTLLMQLSAMQRIIHAADVYSDREVRKHVKEIIADFTAEFKEMDDKHRTMLERLLGWGRAGFFGGSVILGLTADASAVVALLPPPT